MSTQYPTSVPSRSTTEFLNVNDLGTSKLIESISSSSTTIKVDDATNVTTWPSNNFMVRLGGDDEVNPELVTISSRSSTSLTVDTRGVGETEAQSWAADTVVEVVQPEQNITKMIDEIIALATELGTTPSDDHTDVGARLGAVEAPTYLTLSNSTDLNNERAISPGTNLEESDGGAGGSYTLDVSDPFSISDVDFTPQDSPTHQEGRAFYRQDINALSYYVDDSAVEMNIGRESWVRVRNTSGGTISNGDAVFIDGFHANSGLPTVTLAKADAASTARFTGIATHDIADNSNGYITTFGEVRGVDTSAFSAGDKVWVSAGTAGGLTATEPSDPNFSVRVGFIAQSSTSGQILVNTSDRDIGQLSQGSVPFAGSNGVLTEDNANLSWDSGTNTFDAANITEGGTAVVLETRTLTGGDGIADIGDLSTDQTIAADIVTGGGLVFTTGSLEVNEADVDHDALSNFVANEHIDHSGVSLSAGAGLTGGGDITTSRSFDVGSGTGINANTDDVAIAGATSVHIETVDPGSQTYSANTRTTLETYDAGTGGILVPVRFEPADPSDADLNMVLEAEYHDGTTTDIATEAAGTVSSMEDLFSNIPAADSGKDIKILRVIVEETGGADTTEDIGATTTRFFSASRGEGTVTVS